MHVSIMLIIFGFIFFLHAPLLFLQLQRAVLQLAKINLVKIILRSRLAD